MSRTDESSAMKTFEVCHVEHTDEHIEADTGLYTPEGQDEPIIHLFGYDDDREWHHEKVRGFEPYGYVAWEHRADAESKSWVKRVEHRDEDGNPYLSVREERLVRVVTYRPDGVRKLHKETDYQTWESDVQFPKRFIADMDLESGVTLRAGEDIAYHDLSSIETTRCHTEWRVHTMDIEVDDRQGFPENGTEPILCITAHDSFLDEYVVWLWHEDYDEPDDLPTEAELHDADVEIRWCETERQMLLNYLSYIQATKPAIFTAWNVDFDLEYLWDRAEVLEERDDCIIPLEAMSPLNRTRQHDYFGNAIYGMAVFDLLSGFKATQYTDLQSYRLENVAQEVIGVGKEVYVGTVGDLWDDDPQTLVEYNLRDVELCVELDRRQDIISFWQEVGRFGRCQLEDAPIESSVVDKYLLNDLHGQYVLPRQGSQPAVEGSYEGGAVFDAVTGLYENVPLLDLASLYPMSMLTLNISPETKVDPDEYDGDTFVAPNDIHFRKDKPGITRRVIENLLDERQAKKDARDDHDPSSERYAVLDRQQTAVKVIMNSLYGVMAWNRFRLYDPEGAQATTACGREVLAFTAQVAEEMGYEVLYGDTDSVLLKMPDRYDRETTIEKTFEVEAEINERYQEFAENTLNADEHYFDIEFEKLYRRFFQSGAKKRYAGWITWKEGKDVEEQDITGYEYRRSDSSPLANETQERVLKMICQGEPDREVADYVHEQIKRVLRREVTLQEIGIPEGIGKRMDDYKSKTQSLKAAQHGNLLLGMTFTKGTKPVRYYLDDVDPNFFADLEAAEVFDIERDTYYNRVRGEDGLPYIAVEDPESLPTEVAIDWEKHKNKCLKQTLSAITNALGLEWDELESDTRQAGLDAFADD